MKDNKFNSKPEITINEFKAPTDQSIEFLNDINEKTKQNIFAVIPVEENNLNGVVVYLTNYMIGYMVDYYIKFTLNGKEHIIHDTIARHKLDQEMLMLGKGFGSDVAREIFYKRILELLTLEIMKPIDFDKIIKNKK